MAAEQAAERSARVDVLDAERPNGHQQQTDQPAWAVEPDPADLPAKVAPPAQQQPPPRAARVLPAGSTADAGRAAATGDVLSMIRHSDEMAEIFAALAAAQGEFGEIERTLTAKIKSDRADYTYDYAPLDEVLMAIRPSLSKHGVSIMQFPFAQGGAVTVRTLLGHKSGQWIYNDLRVVADDPSPRAVGSAITYARRYALQAMTGVHPGHDDDGGRASERRQPEPPRQGQRRSEQASPPAPPAGAAARPPAGRSDGPGQAPAPPTAPVGRPHQPVTRPAAPSAPPRPAEPAAAAPSPPPAEPPAAPSPVGRIVDIIERPNGFICLLDTGFKAAIKTEDLAKAARAFRATTNAIVELRTRPSSDPAKWAPIVDEIVLVPREPGQEG